MIELATVRHFAILLAILISAGAVTATPPAIAQPERDPAAPVRVVVSTALGSIEIEVDRARAPVTAANFLHYVDAGLYEGGRFHRTVTMDNQPGAAVRIEVIQAGIDPARAADEQAPIPLERTSKTGLSHRHGTVSMARAEPDSATSDFFICIGDQPSLDFGGARNPDGQGFAAFGVVVAGMDVVERIHASPASAQKLEPPIAILQVARKR
jgi:peptidyl-prolyl cis-trans isomerase A (cyclophilin A)